MLRKFMRGIGAVFFLSIFFRAVFYLCFTFYVIHKLANVDFVAIPIGILSLYLSYLYFRQIFRKDAEQLRWPPA